MATDPIQTHESNRLHLLNTLFPHSFPLSSDLQQLILDFTYPRKISEKKFKNDKCWVRLSLALKNNKYYYELSLYNDKVSIIISSYSITKSKIAVNHFNLIDKFENTMYDTPALFRRISLYSILSAYFFSPVNGLTYRFEAVHGISDNFNIRILEIPKIPASIIYVNELPYKCVAVVSKFESNDVAIYREMIEKYGSDWSQYPNAHYDLSSRQIYGDLKYGGPDDDIFEST